MTTSAASNPYILELRDLQKTYNHDLFKRRETILRNLTCRFRTGQCTGLLGHNGAGKTTTIRMIFGLIRPDKGSVLFKGQPIAQTDKSFIGYMPETNKLPPTLTPEEILHHQLLIFNQGGSGAERRQRVDASLARVGLSEHRRKRVGKLSKGMGRRLAWAQATIHNPELVVLDEPSSGLDPLGRQQMSEWIRELKGTGASIILCTHEMWSIQNLCDDLHVLRRGELIYSTVEDVRPADFTSTGLTARRPGATYYRLQVSGIPSPDKLHRDANLPTWTAMRQEKFLSNLFFDDYSNASQWVQACAAKGYLIVSFGDAPIIDEPSLLTLFDGGNSK